MSFKHFRREEFNCKHCGGNLMQDDFIHKLDKLRDAVGFPLVVTSGYRCPTHNQRVSTTGPNGPHTTGRAVDLGVDRTRALHVLQHTMFLGFTGFGIQQKGASRFLHLDDLGPPHPRPNIWSY